MWGRKNAQDYFTEGNNHVANGKYDKALLAYYQAHQKKNKHALEFIQGIIQELSQSSSNVHKLDDIDKPKLLEIIDAAFKNDQKTLLEILKSCETEGNALGDKFWRARYPGTKCEPNKSSLKTIHEKIAAIEIPMNKLDEESSESEKSDDKHRKQPIDLNKISERIVNNPGRRK